MKFFSLAAIASLAFHRGSVGFNIGWPNHVLVKEDLLQDIVTWDEHSLLISGKRLMVFSGEVHPYRLPVPSLYIDVLQKIKALGFQAVSFYVDWALLEGTPGEFRAEGVFDYEPFFVAAKEAGLYLIARPGPYVNAEVSGGGFPGWLQRVKGQLRTNDTDFLAATDNYMANICQIIAKYQITEGGPIILLQPENEYSGAEGVPFPSGEYMQYVEDQARKAGIVIPLISNDASPQGINAPGTGPGEVDIYGHDNYPLGFDCANPNTWPRGALPTNYRTLHEQQSPTTPYSVVEFQGGAFDPWGGLGFDQCAMLVNHEFERVFYKNLFSFGATILNIYMTYGGTNWGNLGHPGGYTSYDYGDAIKEDRTVTREKYSELKLEAQFLKVSPTYLTAVPQNLTVGKYSDKADVTVTPVVGNGSYFVVRHSDYASTASVSYTLRLPTSAGELSIPQLGGSLSLSRRDSKIHVTDYPVGSSTLLYSTAEIFTWKRLEDKIVLVVYGGPDELHEIAVKKASNGTVVEGDGVTLKATSDAAVAQWKTTTDRRIVRFGDLHVYILDRNSAYNYWVPETSDAESIIVNGGYLVRTASIEGDTAYIKADFNSSTTLEIIGIPKTASKLVVNDKQVNASRNGQGSLTAAIPYSAPDLSIPDLQSLDWYYIDSLPEIQPGYDDSEWTNADHSSSNNSIAPLLTNVSLYSSDYGYHTGVLLYRGHFTSTGDEAQLYLATQGGSAFGSSVWLDSTFVGSWTGIDAARDNNATYTLPNMAAARQHVLTVVVDNMGLDENWVVGPDEMKRPRGILDWRLAASDGAATDTAVEWKLTGNLGGEQYADKARGPLNEGGLFAERSGFHQPAPPVSASSSSSSSSPFTQRTPYEGIDAAGVAFYTARLDLDLPAAAYDVPLAFVFANDTAAAAAPGGAYRAQLYVNGWQFGKYVSNVGPQTAFPVPEGILDYGGENWVALALWALEAGGARVPGLELRAGPAVATGREPVAVVPSPRWAEREGAY